jgi:hypothetical protein
VWQLPHNKMHFPTSSTKASQVQFEQRRMSRLNFLDDWSKWWNTRLAVFLEYPHWLHFDPSIAKSFNRLSLPRCCWEA